MNIEDQLREYRSTLDAATEAATSTRTDRAIAPVIRIRPARTLAVAAVAVAAAIAVAFAVVGATHKTSTPPAGVTTTPPTTTSLRARTARVPNVIGMPLRAAETDLAQLVFLSVVQDVHCRTLPIGHVLAQLPPAGSTARIGSTITLQVCNTSAAGATPSVPVKVCPTEYGIIPAPDDPRAPKTLSVASPPFTDPALAGYSDLRGYLPVIAPAGWNCKAIEATDGGQGVGVTPPGATPRDAWGVGGQVTQPPTDGVFAELEPACQGCVRGEVCGIVPSADADFPDFASLPCPQPAGQTVTALGHDVYRIDDPPGALGPDAARSLLRYTPPGPQIDATVARETCILPASQQAVCDWLLDDFLARQPAPWTQPALTISPTALGAVAVGESRAAAQSGAGLPFDAQGDGFAYPQSLMDNGVHLYVGLAPNGTTASNEKVACVGAEIVIAAHAKAQRITTPEGFALGETVGQLLAVYGSRAVYVPAPASGMTTNAGYVVKEAGGALAFAIHQSTVFEIAGGSADITPNSCTG